MEISIQLGSILAIIAYERAKLASLASHALREQQEFRSLIANRGTKSWATTIQESINAQPNLWFVIGLGLAFLPRRAGGIPSPTSRSRPISFADDRGNFL